MPLAKAHVFEPVLPAIRHALFPDLCSPWLQQLPNRILFYIHLLQRIRVRTVLLINRNYGTAAPALVHALLYASTAEPNLSAHTHFAAPSEWEAACRSPCTSAWWQRSPTEHAEEKTILQVRNAGLTPPRAQAQILHPMLFHAQLALLSHLCLQLPPAISSSPMPEPALAPPLTAAWPSSDFCVAGQQHSHTFTSHYFLAQGRNGVAGIGGRRQKEKGGGVLPIS